MTKNRMKVVGVAAFVAPLVLALVLVPFRSSFASSAAALCFLALITGVALVGNRASGVLASVSSALWFDLFLTQPYDRLTISHRPDLETTVSLVVVGVLVGELAVASHRFYQRALVESDYVSAVHELAVMVGGPSSTHDVLQRTTSSLRDVLMLRECEFELVPSGHPYARILANGAVHHVGLAWPTKDIGLPGPKAEILAQWRDQVVGRFVLTPTPGQSVSLERRIVAVTLASLAASAVANDTSTVATTHLSGDT